uniref:Putative kinesin-3 n=1 Tax=Davidia involucrata TaxID=16924 RepID=A0A5B7A4P9_DAVIN
MNPSSTCEIDQTLETATCDIEQVEGNSDLMDESNVSNETQEMCSDEVQTLPILQKIEDLSNRVQNLKKEHMVLCNEVKGMTADSFPGCDVLSALQALSTEHELLKKKYHEECELLKKKYLEECSERKQLYNEVIELKGNIRVFCRCRPLNQNEIANGSTFSHFLTISIYCNIPSG